MAFVLIVDDDPEYGPFLARLLDRLGHSSFAIARGDDALRYMKKFRPDLVLLDLCLPGLSAEKTLQMLKTQETTRDIPVIAISGLRERPEDEAAVRGAGADLFLTKREISDSIKNRVFQRRIEALIRAPRRAPAAAKERQSRAPAIAGPGRVLVVDDDEEMRRLLALILTGGGYTVLTAATALDGLAKVRQGYPDLVVLDQTLPDMSGLEVCSQLKSDPALRHIPVMVLTGDSSRDAELQAIRRQANHFMTKPLESAEKFLDVAAALLDRARAEPSSPQVLRIGDALVIDEAARTLSVGGRSVANMPPTLFRLACEFARNPGRTLTRDQLVGRIYEDKRIRDRNVDLSVQRLRCVLGEPVRRWIVTVRRHGYRFIPGVSSDSSGAK